MTSINNVNVQPQITANTSYKPEVVSNIELAKTIFSNMYDSAADTVSNGWDKAKGALKSFGEYMTDALYTSGKVYYAGRAGLGNPEKTQEILDTL